MAGFYESKNLAFMPKYCFLEMQQHISVLLHFPRAASPDMHTQHSQLLRDNIEI